MLCLMTDKYPAGYLATKIANSGEITASGRIEPVKSLENGPGKV